MNRVPSPACRWDPVPGHFRRIQPVSAAGRLPLKPCTGKARRASGPLAGSTTVTSAASRCARTSSGCGSQRVTADKAKGATFFKASRPLLPCRALPRLALCCSVAAVFVHRWLLRQTLVGRVWLDLRPARHGTPARQNTRNLGQNFRYRYFRVTEAHQFVTMAALGQVSHG